MGIKKIAVLYGGKSAERDVSIESGKNIYAAILELGYEASLIDCPKEFTNEVMENHDYLFIALHGEDGESGGLQKILSDKSIPYSGSDSVACSRTWNKARCKEILNLNNIPTPQWISVDELSQESCNLTSDKFNVFNLNKPLFLKPEEEGSSIDVFKITNESDLSEAILNCTNNKRPFIFEECIEHKELTVPVLNGRCLPAVEIITSESFYNYKAKYEKDDTQLLQIKYSPKEQKILESICMNTFDAMGCKGWARIDLLQDYDDEFYVLEINTVPGMTSHSLFPASAKSAGLDYKSLIQEIINESLPL